MTVSSGFFNSLNHDRLYDAEQLSSIFDGIIIDGVYQGVGDAFAVTAVSDQDNTVSVGTGRAWFDHTWTVNDLEYAITLDPPNEMLGRIDAIVLDINREESTRKNSILLVKGTMSSDPQKPTLVKSNRHNQYPLAYITLPAGSSGPISNSNIENKIGTSDCPLVTGVLETLDVDTFVNQMNSKFDIWFEGIKDLMDENTALNLQNQIEEVRKVNERQDVQIDRLNQANFDFADGRNLGSSITTEQYELISSGKFTDMYPGDYWTINGVKYYIVGFDGFMGRGDIDGTNPITEHHLVLAPGKLEPTNPISKSYNLPNLFRSTDDLDYYVVANMVDRFDSDASTTTYQGAGIPDAECGFGKIYTNTVSNLISLTDSAKSEIINAFGEDHLIDIPQPEAIDFQNFEVKRSKVIIPHDYEIGVGYKNSNFYNLIGSSAKYEWLMDNPGFYVGNLGYHRHTLPISDYYNVNPNRGPERSFGTFIASDKYEQTLLEYDGSTVGYVPTYRCDDLYEQYFTNVIDPVAANFHTKIYSGNRNHLKTFFEASTKSISDWYKYPAKVWTNSFYKRLFAYAMQGRDYRSGGGSTSGTCYALMVVSDTVASQIKQNFDHHMNSYYWDACTPSIVLDYTEYAEYSTALSGSLYERNIFQSGSYAYAWDPTTKILFSGWYCNNMLGYNTSDSDSPYDFDYIDNHGYLGINHQILFDHPDFNTTVYLENGNIVNAANTSYMGFIDRPLSYTDLAGQTYYPHFGSDMTPYTSPVDHLTITKNTNSAITLIAVKG